MSSKHHLLTGGQSAVQLIWKGGHNLLQHLTWTGGQCTVEKNGTN